MLGHIYMHICMCPNLSINTHKYTSIQNFKCIDSKNPNSIINELMLGFYELIFKGGYSLF